MKPNRNPYLVNLIVCWVYLAVSVIITLTGSDYFAYDTSLHPQFNKFCVFLDTYLIAKIIVSLITSLIGNTLLVLCILNKRKLTVFQAIVFTILTVGISISGWFLPILQLVLNIIFFVVPIFYLKKKFYRIPIAICLTILVQQALLFIREVGNWYLSSTTSTYASITLQLDVIIITFMYYTFITRKEVN